jgi:3-oxoacyl-[acyl-carrier protein] reductase
MTFQFEGKVSIVTGAGSGIGRATSIAFAKAGAKVALVDISERDANVTQKIIAELGGTSIVVLTDLSKLKFIQMMVDKVLEEYGDIDCLANLAGIYPIAKVLEVTEEHWDKVLNLDLKSVFFTCQSVLKHMISKKKGAIVNITSGVAYYPILGYTTYTAAKGGLHSVTRLLALEAAPYGVHVNTISPGPTITEGLKTEMRSKGIKEEEMTPEFLLSQFKGRPIPAGTIMTPEMIANAIMFLCSDEARGIYGALINVNGGNHMP